LALLILAASENFRRLHPALRSKDKTHKDNRATI
jgi:hypothetical protein